MKIYLKKNLRKSILRGHPWIYGDALKMSDSSKPNDLVQIYDNKGFLAWGFYDPYSPIKVRVLSTQSQKPNQALFLNRVTSALRLRKNLSSQGTNAFRCINGEADYLPGCVCDIYNDVAVLQFDGQGPHEFWTQYLSPEELLKTLDVQSLYLKCRHINSNRAELIAGRENSTPQILENYIKFEVDILNGQKTGFFLDQRENRNYVRHLSHQKRVLNLFSYTGGFSVYAGAGGASHVCSVDIAQAALAQAQCNWELNNLPKERHEIVTVDVHDFLQVQLRKGISPIELWDVIIVDPPSMAKAKEHKEIAIRKYVELFSLAAKLLSPQGHLILSSCSSHINFEDFHDIISECLSKVRKRGQILRVSGQAPDHPYLQACREQEYLKFFDIVVSD